MASNCDISKGGADDLAVIQEAIREATITDADILGMGDFVLKVEDYLKEASEKAIARLLYDVVPEDEIEDFIKNEYGAQADRYFLAFKIATMFSANPHVMDRVEQLMWQYMPFGKTNKGDMVESPLFGKGGLTEKQFNKLSRADQLKQVLRVQSVANLKVIYSTMSIILCVYVYKSSGTDKIRW